MKAVYMILLAMFYYYYAETTPDAFMQFIGYFICGGAMALSVYHYLKGK